MFTKIVLAALMGLLLSCKKDNDTLPQQKTASELLTRQEWILSGAGFDDNKNGILDDSENTIQECQKDNSFIFHPAGNGSSLDNALSCGVPVDNNFNWHFLNNETEIEIALQKMFIEKLTEDDLILRPDLPALTVKFMLIYHH